MSATPLPKAFIDGEGPGWKAWGAADFANVNCDEDTWSWEGGLAHCTGEPIGVIRSVEPLTNFELVVTWRHLRSAGNSGVFLWASPESIARLEAGEGNLPDCNPATGYLCLESEGSPVEFKNLRVRLLP